jgi:hypothetical protein
MKRLNRIALMMVVGLALGARAEGDLPLFYEELQPEGAWFKLDGRAWVWQPKAMQLDSSWRPYVNAGCWTRHEENWFWVSEYPWGAVAFHYGRWYPSASNGWVWVPGTQWCPAWVDWQLTDTHSGWAPLQPEDEFFAALGLAPPAYDWSRYAFVPNTAFLEKDLLPYVRDGTAFADAAVSQVAGPATDRVGLQQAVVAYSEMTPTYYYDTTPVSYYETTPTVIYSDARYALWWPFSLFAHCRRDHRHSSGCEPPSRHHSSQPPPPSRPVVTPTPIHQVPAPLPPKTDRWAAPGRQQPATPPPKTDGWMTPGRQPSPPPPSLPDFQPTPSRQPATPPPSLPDFQPTPSRQPATPPPSLPDFQPTPSRQPSTPPPSMPDFRPTPSRQPATPPPSKTDYRPTPSRQPATPPPSMPDYRPTPSRQPSTPPPSKTDFRPSPSRQPATPPPSRPAVAPAPSRQPSAPAPISPVSNPQPKLSQPPQGRPSAGSSKPK